MKSEHKKRFVYNLIFYLVLALCYGLLIFKQGWTLNHIPIFLLFLLFPALRRDNEGKRAFTDFVLEKRFGRKYELVRGLGVAVLLAGFLFSMLWPDDVLGMQVFLLTLLFFFLHGLWLILVIADQKAIWREKWQQEPHDL